MATRFIWRKQYDDAADLAIRNQTRTVNDEPALTQQHHAESADLNVLVARFGLGDVSLPPAAADPRFYGDFTGVPDFRQALDTTREAVDRFNALPAAIRTRFDNDPIKLYAFVIDPANVEESVKLGLLTRENIPAPEPLPAPEPVRT